MSINFWVTPMFLLLLSCSGTPWAQATQQHRTVVVNGQAGEAAAVQINGRAYIDLETLARIGNGSLRFQGTQIILTLPIAIGDASESQHPATTGLSREFMKAGIEEIALLREWASPLANAMQNGYPVTENWVAGYREKAASGLRLTTVAATTSEDHNALQLLTNEFEAVKEWSNKLVETRKSMDAKYSISASALQDDPLSQKIVNCSRFLGPMLEGGSFQDDPSCH